MILNLFYEEPDPNRWLPFDRYPRRIIRRIVRGKPRPGGQMLVFLNLCAGLDRLGVKYRINDYRHARRHPEELACIIGKPHVLDKIPWKNPILFGAGVYSHPSDDPDLLKRLPIKKILVPGEWMRKMCEPYWGDKVAAWPAGIDTRRWCPSTSDLQQPAFVDFLIYDKIYWEREKQLTHLLNPLKEELQQRNLSFAEIRYGFYQEHHFQNILKRSRAMIFLSANETQGIAYQQALSCDVPVFAWDRGGFWQDPAYYPHKVKFQPVSSVPYWDQRCGMKFKTISEFSKGLDEFCVHLQAGAFRPRDYILENLTLEKCANEYLRLSDACLK